MFRVCYVHLLGDISLEQQVKYLRALKLLKLTVSSSQATGEEKKTEIQSKFVLFRNLMVPVNMENIPGLTQKTKLVNQISEP